MGRVHDEQLVVGDAFGATLRECFEADARPGVSWELIERSDGFLAAGDAARYFGSADDWASPTQPFASHIRGRVLDIGAGAGRVALALQDLNCDVTALDVSPGAVEVCAARGVRITFCGTVTDLAATEPRPFDTFVLAGNNLGLLGGVDQGRDFLACLAALAAPNARVIGEITDPYRTTDPVHTAYHEANRRLGRLGGQIRLRVRHHLLVTEWFDYLFCTPAELDELVHPTGWRVETAHTRGDENKASATWIAVLAQRRDSY